MRKKLVILYFILFMRQNDTCACIRWWSYICAKLAKFILFEVYYVFLSYFMS